MTMNKIDVHLTLTQAELDLLMAALMQVEQEHRSLAARAKHQANFYRYCLTQTTHAVNTLAKLEGFLADALVDPHQACPCCGERQHDRLVFNPGNTGKPKIACASCGTEYELPEW